MGEAHSLNHEANDVHEGEKAVGAAVRHEGVEGVLDYFRHDFRRFVLAHEKGSHVVREEVEDPRKQRQKDAEKGQKDPEHGIFDLHPRLPDPHQKFPGGDDGYDDQHCPQDDIHGLLLSVII